MVIISCCQPHLSAINGELTHCKLSYGLLTDSFQEPLLLRKSIFRNITWKYLFCVYFQGAPAQSTAFAQAWEFGFKNDYTYFGFALLSATLTVNLELLRWWIAEV